MIIVVLPAYNEEEAIAPLLHKLARTLEARFQAARVIVVDDGSTDNTASLVRAFQKERRHAEVRLVEHGDNRGLSEAIKTGLRHALHEAADEDIVVTMDADNTHSPGLIFRMALLIEEGSDVVIASRYAPGAQEVGLSAQRRVLSWGASWLFRVLFPFKGVKDYTCGYRAYRAAVLKEAFARWGENFVSEQGFSCMVDILLKLRQMGVVVTEAPLILRYDLKPGASKMNVGQTMLDTLRLIGKRLRGIDA